MDRLPNCEQAVVPVEKVRDYLLNDAHPEGSSKARFLFRFGFTVQEFDVLQKALLATACVGRVVRVINRPPYGTRYVVRALLPSPDGRTPEVTIAWFIDADDSQSIPRLATLVPEKAKLP